MRWGFNPAVATFNSLIKGLCLENRSLKAMELFKKMVVFGVRPDIVSYGSIVNGLCKDGLVDKTK